jgi:hypothetical protein
LFLFLAVTSIDSIEGDEDVPVIMIRDGIQHAVHGISTQIPWATHAERIEAWKLPNGTISVEGHTYARIGSTSDVDIVLPTHGFRYVLAQLSVHPHPTNDLKKGTSLQSGKYSCWWTL